MLSKALAVFFLLCASAAVCCLAVGGTPEEKRVFHLFAPDVGFRDGVLGCLGGVGNCCDTFDHGLPLTPDEAGYLPIPDRRVASNFALC